MLVIELMLTAMVIVITNRLLFARKLIPLGKVFLNDQLFQRC